MVKDDSKVWQRRDILRMGGLASVGLSGSWLLSSCGQSGTANNADKTATLQIVNTSSTDTFAIQQLLKQPGYLQKFGVHATIKNLSDGTKVLAAISSGHADIQFTGGMGDILAAIEKGEKLKLLGGFATMLRFALYSANPSIRRVEDLAGKSVGTGSPGALLSQFMTLLLQKHNVDPSKVRFVDIGSSADVLRAVVAKKVDAGPSLVDVYNMQKELGIHVVANIWEELPRFISEVIYVSDTALHSKRDAIVGTVAALIKLSDFIENGNSRDAYVKAYKSVASASNTSKRATSIWDFEQKYKPYPKDLVLNKSSLSYMENLAIKNGSIKKFIPLDQLLDTSVITDAMKLIRSSG